MWDEKVKQIIQVLYLRKILRAANCQYRNRLLGRFGIGIIKYEICSNLKGKKQIQNVFTVKKNSITKKIYSLVNNNFSEQKIDIIETDSQYTQIEQITNDYLVSSGGLYQSKSRFIIHSEKTGTQNFQMQHNRTYHRTRNDQYKYIYIISGFSQKNNKYIDEEECELFNMQIQSFKCINQIKKPISLFGCDQVDKKVYTFGGYN